MQVIHDTGMSGIDSFAIMFDVFWYWSLARRYALFCIANKLYGISDKKCVQLRGASLFEWRWWENLPHAGIAVFFLFKIGFIGERDKESTTPWLW